MWVGGYSLDLYCDNATTGDKIHAYDEFPHQYDGEIGSHCRSRARKAGWMLGQDGSAICPKCTRNRAKYFTQGEEK
jgi:hypothetical protein